MPQTRAEFCIALANSGNLTFADNAAKLRFLTDCQNNAEQYGYDPQWGVDNSGGLGTSDTLPGFGGPPGSSNPSPTNPDLPTITLPDSARIAACIASATRAFQACVATYPGHEEDCRAQFIAMRANCYGNGPAQDPQYAQASACAGCTGLDTLPACFSCWSTALGQNLQKVGWNVALFALAALGLYFFLQREA